MRRPTQDPETCGHWSGWEIAVKYELGHLELSSPPDVFVPEQRLSHRIDELPLSERSTLLVHRLPRLHRDPFDRMLVCQAIDQGLTLLTPDPQIVRYPVKTLW